MKTPPAIKTPCPMRWDAMSGDSRTRFCEHCQLHVHNLSAMSGRGVTRLLRRGRKGQHACVTYMQRADGSMVTRADLFRERLTTPFRRAFSWLLAAFVPMAFGACATEPPRRQLMGVPSPNCQDAHPAKTGAKNQDREIVTGGVFIPSSGR